MNDSLIFNVAQLLREPVGAIRTGEVVVPLSQLTPELAQVASLDEAMLSGYVRLMHALGGVVVQGRLKAEISQPCARCLEPVAVPLDVPLEEVFVPTVDIVTGRAVQVEEEDRALWIDDKHLLDLTEVLRQNVLVSVPMFTVCREECKGLCPNCGQNLNEGPCSCEPEVDPRWSALRDLLS